MHPNPANGRPNGNASDPAQRRAARPAARRRAASTASLPSVRDVVYVLFKHRAKSACVAAGVLAVALAAAATVPSRFASESQLLVRMGRESMPNSTVAGGPQAAPMLDRTTEVNSEAQILRSVEVVNRTVDRIGVATLLGEAPSFDAAKLAEQKARAARTIASKIEVRTEPLSAIIKVSYEAASATTARDVVAAYVDQYLDHRAAIYGGRGAGDLFAGLTKESQAKLLGIEEQMRALKDRTGVSDVDAQKTVLLSRTATLQNALDVGGAQLASTISRVHTLEEQLDATPRQVTLSRTLNEPMSVVSNAQTDLNKLRADLDQRLGTYLPNSPTVVQLQEQIARAERRLKDIGSTREPEVVGMNPTWSDLDKQLAVERTNQDGYDAQVQSLVVQLAGARRGLSVMNELELKMGQLARERSMLIEQIRKLVEGRDFSSIDQAMSKDRVGSVTASQAATLAARPSSPNRMLLVLFGLFASIAGGAATALVAEMLDPNVGRPLDLKRLGFRRVVSLPNLKMSGKPDPEAGGASARMQALRELSDREELDAGSTDPTRVTRGGRLAPINRAPLTYSTGEAMPVTAPSPAIATLSAPAIRRSAALFAPLTEMCHAMLERLVLAPVATGELEMPRSIAIVPILPRQGATTIAAHFAAALAEYVSESGDVGHVLIVDANVPRNGSNCVTDLVGDCHAPACATTSEPAIRPSAVRGLDALVADEPQAGERRYGRWADAVTDALQRSDRLVVVDLPCMAGNEATARVAGACDAAILVVEAGQANAEVVRQAGRRLAESGVRLLGVVLNRRAYPIPEVLYRWI